MNDERFKALMRAGFEALRQEKGAVRTAECLEEKWLLLLLNSRGVVPDIPVAVRRHYLDCWFCSGEVVKMVKEVSEVTGDAGAALRLYERHQEVWSAATTPECLGARWIEGIVTKSPDVPSDKLQHFRSCARCLHIVACIRRARGLYKDS